MISQPLGGGRRVKQQFKSHLPLVNFYLISAKFQIKRARFSLVFPTCVQFCTQILLLCILDVFSSQFLDDLKKLAHIIISRLSVIFQVTKNLFTSNINERFNLRQKRLCFWIITKQSSYHLMGLCSNKIYNLFIVEWSYEYLCRNVGNPFRSFHDHMYSFDCQPINTLN